MKPTPSRVLILHNIPRAGRAWVESDAGVLEEVRAVQQSLDRLGMVHRTEGVRVLDDLPPLLAASRETVVFNLVESFHRREAETNLVPAICEAFGKGCTGSDSISLTLSLDKWQAKAALRAAGLPTPHAAIVPTGHPFECDGLPEGPIIVKPVATDASEGIDAGSVFPRLGPPVQRAVRQLHRQFAQPVLVEQFIDGRELNVSVIQRGDRVDVLPIAEIDFSAFKESRPKIVGYAAKWLSDTFEFNHTPRIMPAPLPARAARDVRRCALGAWKALGCRDYVRVDFRLDRQGRPLILELNPNPDISPDAGFAAALEAAGLSYEQFVQKMVQNADQRRRTRTGGRRAPNAAGKL